MGHLMYFIGKDHLNIFNSSIWTICNIICYCPPSSCQKKKKKLKNKKPYIEARVGISRPTSYYYNNYEIVIFLPPLLSPFLFFNF